MTSPTTNESTSSEQPIYPLASLKSSLSHFEGTLSKDQASNFEKNCVLPQGADALVVVSNISGGNQNQSASLGLCAFLQRTIQFTSIIHNLTDLESSIAVKLWGSVVTTIQTTNNDGQLFDTFAAAITKISRDSATDYHINHLCSGSTELLIRFSNYYAKIIDLCTRATKISSRSGTSTELPTVCELRKGLFDDLVVDLAHSVLEIHNCIASTSVRIGNDQASLAVVDPKENAIHKRVMARFRSNSQPETERLPMDVSSRQMMQHQLEIKENLSAIDHLNIWRKAKQEHLPGTAEWFLYNNEFSRWAFSTESSILWLSGSRGSGKTVFTSNVIAQLSEARRESSDHIAYFICRADDVRTLQSRNIIGSIFRQFFELSPSTRTEEDLLDLVKRSKTQTAIGLTEVMLEELDDKIHFIILDGLDECETADIQEVAKALALLHEKGKGRFRIFCSSRRKLKTKLFEHVQPTHHLSLIGKNINTDVERYVSMTLARYSEDHDPGWASCLQEALQSQTNKTFLWVKLMIDDLRCCNSEDEIKTVLADLPSNVSEIYDRKMKWIDQQPTITKAHKALELCCVSRRPFTIDEIREALTVEFGQKFLKKDLMVGNIDEVLLACRGLLCVDEQDLTIHLIHNSTREYLLDFLSSENNSLDIQLGCLCLTYLNFSDFERRVIKQNQSIVKITMNKDLPDLKQQKTARIAQKLLRFKGGNKPIQFDLNADSLQLVAQKVVKEEAEKYQEGCNFLRYAREHWIYHLQTLSKINGEPRSWHLFCEMVAKQNHIEQNSAPFSAMSPNNQQLIEFALEHDHAGLIRYCLDKGSLNSKEQRFTRLLIDASSKRCYKVRLALIETLSEAFSLAMDNDMDHNNFLLALMDHFARDEEFASSLDEGYFLKQALQDAIKSDYKDMVRELFAKAEANCTKFDATDLFRYAVTKGQTGIVRSLVRTYEVDINGEFSDESMPIQVAAINERTDMVFQLLELGASAAHEVVYTDLSPLAAAAWNGDILMAEALISNGAEVNPPTKQQGKLTPLQAAAQHRQVEMVEVLLKAKADPNFTHNGQTRESPLELACQSGHPDIVEKLLIAGAEINHKGTTSILSPIICAIRGGVSSIVRQLIKRGVDFENTTTKTEVMIEAIRQNHLEVVQILVNEGKILDPSSRRHSRASEERRMHMRIIDLAASLQHKEILEFLLLHIPRRLAVGGG